MPVRLVLFDLDGTLVNSMELYADKASELMAKYYRIRSSEARELYLKTSGLPFLEQLNLVFPDKKRLNQKVASEFEDWKKEIVRNLKIEPDGVEVLRSLRKRGTLTAISSNNLQEYVEEILRNSGAEADFVLGWDSGNFKKGEPHISFLETRTGLSRKHFLMVGDSPNDLRLSKNSGISFVALTRSFPPEVFRSMDRNVPTIDSLKELLNLIDSLPSQRPQATLSI